MQLFAAPPAFAGLRARPALSWGVSAREQLRPVRFPDSPAPQRVRWTAAGQDQARPAIRWLAQAKPETESADVARDLENGRTLKQAAGWRTKPRPLTDIPSSAAEIGSKFPRCVRIVDPRDFAYVYYRAKRKFGRLIIIDAIFPDSSSASNGSEGGYAPTPSPFARIGITVSRKYGKGHERVRFKRIVRAAFRSIQQELPPGLLFVVRPRLASKDAKSTDIAQEMLDLLLKQGPSTPTYNPPGAAPAGPAPYT